jgi:hypothetical protein
MYSNSKNLPNCDNVKYNIIYDNEYNSLLIQFSNNDNNNKSIKNFVTLNKELEGKEYELISADMPLYKSSITLNKNIFPVNIFPLYELTFHKLIVLVRNVNNDFELNFQIEMTSDEPIYAGEEIYNEIHSIVKLLEWPLCECVTCKKDSYKYHNYNKKQYLKFCMGMCGLNLDNNCYEYDVIFNIEKNISNYNNFENENIDNLFKINTFYKYNVKFIKIKDKLNNLSDFGALGFLVNELVKFGLEETNSENEFFVMTNRKSKCINTENNIFNFMCIPDAINDVEFLCKENKILKIELIQYNTLNKTNTLSEIDFIRCGNIYKINSDIFMVNINNKSCIKIYSENNNPINIKYNIVAFSNKIRRTLACCNNLFLVVNDMPIDKILFESENEIFRNNDIVEI